MDPKNLLTINIIQLIIPFIAFGDKATDLWFIANIAQDIQAVLSNKVTYADKKTSYR